VPPFSERLRGAIQMTPGRAAPKANGRSQKGLAFGTPHNEAELIDLQRRRDQLNARVAELQWDLGGLVYEMASRDRIRVDVLVRRAAELQKVDSELGEVERILRGRRVLLAVRPAAAQARSERRNRRVGRRRDAWRRGAASRTAR
jgi:hypothetical protein